MLIKIIPTASAAKTLSDRDLSASPSLAGFDMPAADNVASDLDFLSDASPSSGKRKANSSVDDQSARPAKKFKYTDKEKGEEVEKDDGEEQPEPQEEQLQGSPGRVVLSHDGHEDIHHMQEKTDVVNDMPGTPAGIVGQPPSPILGDEPLGLADDSLLAEAARGQSARSSSSRPVGVVESIASVEQEEEPSAIILCSSQRKLTADLGAATAQSGYNLTTSLESRIEKDQSDAVTDTTNANLGPESTSTIHKALSQGEGGEAAKPTEDGEDEKGFWASTLKDPYHARALASCARATHLNDDVMNASLEMLASQSPHLRTLNALEINGDPDLLQRAVDRILPLHHLGQSSGTFDHLTLFFGFQPVAAHWVLAWLDLDARKADIYDSKPSASGSSPAAHRRVCELIKLLPTPFNNNTEWDIQTPSFARQPNCNDCGVYAIAAAFYRAAGLSPPDASRTGRYLDSGLWRLLCKSMLTIVKHVPSAAEGGSQHISSHYAPALATVRNYIPSLDDEIRVPYPEPSIFPPLDGCLRAAAVPAAVQAWIDHAQSMKQAALDAVSTRSVRAEEAGKRARFIRKKLLPRASSTSSDEENLRRWASRLDHNAQCAGAALAALKNCRPIEQGVEDLTDVTKALQAKLAMIKRLKKAIWARICATRHGREVFAAIDMALHHVEKESAGVAESYKMLMPEMPEI